MVVLRASQWILLGSLLLGATGCSFFHDLKPHRMHRLNRVPDMMQGSGYNFSIPPEPIPEMTSAEDSHAPSCASNVCSE